MDRIRGGNLPRDGARHERVGRERKERTVLFEAADGKDGDLTGDTGPRSRTSSVVSSGNRPDTVERVPELSMFSRPFRLCLGTRS